jgi:hypothetical protein
MKSSVKLELASNTCRSIDELHGERVEDARLSAPKLETPAGGLDLSAITIKENTNE